MAIRVRCRCGRALEFPDDDEGAWVRCPACGLSVWVRKEEPEEFEGEAGPGMACARCGRSVAAGLVVCPHCGGNPHTGAPPTADVGPVRTEAVEEEGFFRLCLNMLLHPARTADELTYYLSRRAMLIKAGVLYLSGLCALGVVGAVAERSAGTIGAVLLDLTVGLVMAAYFVSLVGRTFVGGGSFRETLVAFGFLAGLLIWVGLGIGLAAAPITAAGGVEVRLFTVLLGAGFLIWRLLLQLFVIGAIFDCGLGGAFAINLLAVVLSGITYFVLVFRYTL